MDGFAFKEYKSGPNPNKNTATKALHRANECCIGDEGAKLETLLVD